jgi:hypothetical protein
MKRGRPRKAKKVINREFPGWLCPPIAPELKALPGREPHVLYDEPDDVELEQRRKLRTYGKALKIPILTEL